MSIGKFFAKIPRQAARSAVVPPRNDFARNPGIHAPRPIPPEDPAMKRANIIPASRHRLMTMPEPGATIPTRYNEMWRKVANFPENQLQLDKHYLGIRRTGPNPSNAFK